MKKTCFVVMGFGKKSDYQSTPVRVLDLDMTYRNIIKPAVEEAGLECIRADEIVHSGTIDVPMFENLLKADVVVADLSTANCNAFYELGVRHALRPYTTIVIAESQLGKVFDVDHTVIRRYKHLGEDIGYGETMRMRQELKDAIVKILANPSSDSPVYTFLKSLKPPQIESEPAAAAAPAVAPPSASEPSVSMLMQNVEAAPDWATKRTLLNAVLALKPEDSFVIQQLALATYKSKLPDELTALETAKQILSRLDPDLSSDPETLGLWGAIHKRLWEVQQDRKHLDTAITAYEKGFYLKNDYYNAINVAYLLNVRASRSEPADAIADFVMARRIRQRTIEICKPLIESLERGEANLKPDEVYWVHATLAEAWFGLGETAAYEEAMAIAKTKTTKQWMLDSTNEQIAKLRVLLEKSPLRYIAQDAAAG